MVSKNKINRRKFIAIASVATAGTVAGCAGSDSSGGVSDGGSNSEERDSDGDGVPDSRDDFPNDSTRSELLQRGNESYDINEDYYQYLRFSPSQPATLSYDVDVQGDIRIDVILTDGTNFQYFEDGTDWEYYGEGSELDTIRASNEINLGTDRTYYLIMDNTSEGQAAPPTDFDNNRVEVDIEYELYS